MSIPYLAERNGQKILMVEDKPFIMLAGEVHNSNSSSVKYMEGVWEKAQKLGMNSLLMPVTWEMVEPEEGKFDFSVVDGLILQARMLGKHIGFLWFGAWKNAQCYYAPAWVKKNLTTFRRAEMKKGENYCNLEKFYGMPYTSLSYLCEATKTADAKAFATLMEHIREIDEKDNTVIVVQVENETGVMGEAREQSDLADELFASPVPQDFVDYMKSHTETMVEPIKTAVQSGAASGSWAEVFGTAADEIFSAYYIAGYVNTVAAAGKEKYPLPMTVNCWLDKGAEPGIYPSGGPVRKVMEVWKYCAPAIDVMGPDIYVPNFCEICDAYSQNGNPLFIPECATHSYAGLRQVYTVGHHHAMCYSPFGFEEMGEPFSAQQMYLFGADVDDPALQTPQNVDEYRFFSESLQEMMPLLCEKYGTSDLQAVISESEENKMMFGELGIMTMGQMPGAPKRPGVCMAVKVSEDTFYLLDKGMMVIPFSTNPEKPHLDVLVLEDGHFENGEWKPCRRLNGDEVASMNYNDPTLLKLQLFAYK